MDIFLVSLLRCNFFGYRLCTHFFFSFKFSKIGSVKLDFPSFIIEFLIAFISYHLWITFWRRNFHSWSRQCEMQQQLFACQKEKKDDFVFCRWEERASFEPSSSFERVFTTRESLWKKLKLGGCYPEIEDAGNADWCNIPASGHNNNVGHDFGFICSGKVQMVIERARDENKE